MEPGQAHISYRPLRTPKAAAFAAAAFAGIGFAVLQITSFVLLRISIPADSYIQNDWLVERTREITLALGLLPFAGIAFLWFLGVLRDRLGHLEDQFFSTLFFGSGLLYLAMTFSTAAIAGGLLAVSTVDPDLLIETGLLVFSQAIIFKFNNVYAIRMAGMFMFVLGTIWVRTEIQQCLCYSHGGYVYVRLGYHLGAHRVDAALAGFVDLWDRANLDHHCLLLPLVVAFFPDLGVCDQRLHPGAELPL